MGEILLHLETHPGGFGFWTWGDPSVYENPSGQGSRFLDVGEISRNLIEEVEELGEGDEEVEVEVGVKLPPRETGSVQVRDQQRNVEETLRKGGRWGPKS